MICINGDSVILFTFLGNDLKFRTQNMYAIQKKYLNGKYDKGSVRSKM